MTSGTDLSQGLQALINDFAQHAHRPEGIGIEQADLGTLLAVLRTMQSLATNLEIEVRCLRDMEASDAMEQEATDQLSDMLGEMQAKVIRPDFGGRS